jgi:methylamine utilization protein MauE/thioredoxin family protein
MVEIDILARLVAAAILLWAAAAKAAARDPERLEPHGVPRALRAPAYIALALVEAAFGAALLAGLSFAPLAAIGLGVLFTLALARARARGIRRLDCGCFGAKEHRVEVLILRALAFTGVAGLAAFPLEVSRPSGQALVVISLVVLAAAVVVLAALVLALYRQVGLLTLRVGPGVALELAEEGPPLGDPAPELPGLAGAGPELAVFFSPGCRLCRQLAPGVRALGREGLTVHVVYESEEPETFERWAVPGTPFAAHIVDGTVVAKGTVNTLEQLEQLVSIGTERVERAAA